ncbi:MAG: ABC transporter ATP-binding protein [Myxococcota bacterium]
MNTVVETKALTVQFGDFKAVQGISFAVEKGEIFGFLGANGAGKTTTIRVLCGLLTPTSGEAEVFGKKVTESNFEYIKSKVGYMSQKFTLYNDLTVEENLSFAADLRKIPKGVYLKQKKSLLELISFEKPLNTFVVDLPGGMKQKVSLAASMVHDPEIIFLDEPTAGVSPTSRALFWDLIRQLAKNGKTIFVTSHYMDEVEQCHRIALMKDGEIIALDTPDTLRTIAFPGWQGKRPSLEDVFISLVKGNKK